MGCGMAASEESSLLIDLFVHHVTRYSPLPLHNGIDMFLKNNYRISFYSLGGNFSFLNLEISENSNSCRKFQLFT